MVITVSNNNSGLTNKTLNPKLPVNKCFAIKQGRMEITKPKSYLAIIFALRCHFFNITVKEWGLTLAQSSSFRASFPASTTIPKSDTLWSTHLELENQSITPIYQMCHLQRVQMDSTLLRERLLESVLRMMLQWLQGSLFRTYDVFVPGNIVQSKKIEIIKPLHLLCYPTPDFPAILTNCVFKITF